jgi:hypothetical protein
LPRFGVAPIAAQPEDSPVALFVRETADTGYAPESSGRQAAMEVRTPIRDSVVGKLRAMASLLAVFPCETG